MAIDFINPWLLLLVVPVAAFIIWASRHGRRTRKDRYVTAIRMVITMLIILSLAGFSLKVRSDETAVVFVADLSASMSGAKDAMADFIKQSMEFKPEGFKTGVLAFGKNALVEQSIADEMNFRQWETTPDVNHTDIDSALQTAGAIMPGDAGKRIVLMTDGNQNTGDAVKRAMALAQQGVRVDAVFLDSMPEQEVQITSLDIPSELYEGQSYDISVAIDSTVNASAVLRLYADRQLIGQQDVQIQKGENRFIFKDKADTSGIKTYEAELQTDKDGVLQNNQMDAYVNIKGVPTVGIVEGQEGEGREIIKILEAADIKTTLFTPHTLPSDLEELRKFQALILCDVSFDDIGEERMPAIDSFVKVLGRGMLVSGGDNSYMLGGYMGTQLEKMLPVDMDLSKKADIPSLGLVLVIDKSGSMTDGQYGITKLEMAKEAAIRSTEALRPTDSVGVICFDDAASWVVGMRQADDLAEIQDSIGTIRPGGGTNMYPALDLAYKALEEADTKLKHIIVLTDGQSATGDFDGIAHRMAEDGITLSSVAVGMDADKNLLSRLAEIGNGRYYYTDEFSNIPKILTKETYLATQSYLQNRTFYPTVTGYSPIIADFRSGFPLLHGYTATTPKPLANVVLSSDRSDPVLAQWQYGLGNVVAWTSDLRGAWTQDWLTWDKGAEFWLNAVSSILPSDEQSAGLIQVERDGDKGKLTLTTDKTTQSDAVVIAPDGKQQSVELQASRPGQYSGSFDIDEPGVYLVRAQQQEDGKVINAVDSGLAITYSPEYDIRYKSSKRLLEQVVAKTGGRIIDRPEQVFADDSEPVWKQTELAPYLLPLALLLFVLDIALRRLKIEALWAALMASLPERRKYRPTQADEQSVNPAHIDVKLVSPSKPAAEGARKLDERSDERSAVDVRVADKQPTAGEQTADEQPATNKQENGQPADIASRLMDARRTHRQKRL
ncbi:VWA domain-containing protein [Mahella australiensis]|uniref:von Willebrand factor type A n=1 Tax=Mahella australiensis (strain DSM 15567 / CIP 107919 / 50-1 BON) TaxID=697281 RepID=F3ZYI6_MAHA5|nr:VWA domain-containing protein [Mahella australiensis]AEE96728.1 von Willebrand factor type A [Mahella australiensis 50-1 BON]